MSADRQKRWPFVAGFGSLLLFLIGLAANFAQLLTVKYGSWVLAALLVLALVFKGGEWVYKRWRNYRALQARLEEVRDFILRSGQRSTVILLCAQARWLFEHHGQSIRVDELQSEEIVRLNVSRVPLRPNDNLLGMHFAIIGFDEGERAKGTVKLCDSARACIELYEQTEIPRIGDVAIPIEPPDATDVERLLGNILFIVSG